MKLGDHFLDGRALAAPTKPVTFRALSPDGKKIADVNAVLVFVDEHSRQAAMKDALAEMRKRYGNEPIPEARVKDEYLYHLLYHALRDPDDPEVYLCAAGVTELRKALSDRTVAILGTAYEEFCEEEFPENLSGEEFERLVKEAEKKSLPALLTEFGFSVIRRALPSLNAQYGR